VVAGAARGRRRVRRGVPGRAEGRAEAVGERGHRARRPAPRGARGAPRRGRAERRRDRRDGVLEPIARAAARGGAPPVPQPGRPLSDEAEGGGAWWACGVGSACAGREAAPVRTLATRAASLGEARPPVARFGVAPFDALGDALARCATPEAEQTLRAWLEG